MTDSQGTGLDVTKCSTEMKLEKFRYEWKIQRFQSAYEVLKMTMESPTFSTRNGKIKGRVLIAKNIKHIPRDPYREEHMSLRLMLVSCDMAKVDIALTFSLLDRKGQIAHTMSKTATFEEGNAFGIDYFILSDKILGGDFAHDEFTIQLDATYLIEPDHQSDPNQTIPFKIPEDGLSTDFGSLLDDAKLSDVTFSVDGHEFKGHKLILAARSSVFAAMFENDMAESRLNRVVIEDIDKDVFAEFLKFIYTSGDRPSTAWFAWADGSPLIYTDKTEKLDKMADELLRVAEKYGVDKLKLMCVNALFKNLSVDNAAQILILAELYSLSEVKVEVIKFINAHSKAIAETSGFKQLTMSHPYLFIDIFRARAD